MLPWPIIPPSLFPCPTINQHYSRFHAGSSIYFEYSKHFRQVVYPFHSMKNGHVVMRSITKSVLWNRDYSYEDGGQQFENTRTREQWDGKTTVKNATFLARHHLFTWETVAKYFLIFVLVMSSGCLSFEPSSFLAAFKASFVLRWPNALFGKRKMFSGKIPQLCLDSTSTCNALHMSSERMTGTLRCCFPITSMCLKLK